MPYSFAWPGLNRYSSIATWIFITTTLTINSLAGPWQISFQIYRLPRLPNEPASGPAKEDSAFLASIIQWQFLAISADGREFVGILSRWSLAILADGREFLGTLGRWSRVSWHMILDFSTTGQEFVSILGRLSKISRQSWPKICQYS